VIGGTGGGAATPTPAAIKGILDILATAGVPIVGNVAKIKAGMAAGNPLTVTAGIVGLIDEFKQGVVTAIDSVGNFAMAMSSASTSPGGFISSMGQQVTAISDSVPVIGMFGSFLGKATEKLGQFMEGLDQTVERYAKFSPVVGIAQGQAAMIQTLSEFRRAQELGPSLAQYIFKRAELQQKIEDAKMRFIIRVMPIVIRLMEFFEENILPLIESMAEGISSLSGVAVHSGNVLDDMGRIMQSLKEAGLDPIGDIMMGYVAPGVADPRSTTNFFPFFGPPVPHGNRGIRVPNV